MKVIARVLYQMDRSNSLETPKFSIKRGIPVVQMDQRKNNPEIKKLIGKNFPWLVDIEIAWNLDLRNRKIPVFKKWTEKFPEEALAFQILNSMIISEKSWNIGRVNEEERKSLEIAMQEMHQNFPQKDVVAGIYKIITLYGLDTQSIQVITSEWSESLFGLLSYLRSSADREKLKRELPQPK